jgi:archaellum component FlaG (FlaF/FlaG flagellin family)
MIGLRQRGAAIGFCGLILLGPFIPIAAFASIPPVAPPPTTGPSSVVGPSASVPSSGSPSMSTSYTLKPTDFSLLVSPTRLVVRQADQATTQDIRVVNRGQASAQVTVQKRNFTAGVDGSLNYQDDAPYGAAEWLSVGRDSFELTPGSTEVTTVKVTAPEDSEPGDHQVAIVFLVEAGETSANIKINRGIAVPTYITVSGAIDTSASLSNLAAPGFATTGPVPLTATVSNTGTVHRDFRGNESLPIDTAGDRASFPDFTVPRGSVRDISTTWDPPLMCICNPTVQFTNADGTVQSATVRVIVFPLHMLAIFVGLLLVVGLGMLVARRSYRANVTKAAVAMNRPAGRGDD